VRRLRGEERGKDMITDRRTGATEYLDFTVGLVQFRLDASYHGLFLRLVDRLALPLSARRNRRPLRRLAREQRLDAVLALLDRFNERRRFDADSADFLWDSIAVFFGGSKWSV
jgi:hypothetical protein